MSKQSSRSTEPANLLRDLCDGATGEDMYVFVPVLALRAVLDKIAGRTQFGFFDFAEHLQRQREFSYRTFGPGPRVAGVVDHIRKELIEVEAAPNDLGEWIDVVILALDGAWRAGHSPQEIIQALLAKQTKNEARDWPDWRTAPHDRAIEHVRCALPMPLLNPHGGVLGQAADRELPRKCITSDQVEADQIVAHERDHHA